LRWARLVSEPPNAEDQHAPALRAGDYCRATWADGNKYLGQVLEVRAGLIHVAFPHAAAVWIEEQWVEPVREPLEMPHERPSQAATGHVDQAAPPVPPRRAVDPVWVQWLATGVGLATVVVGGSVTAFAIFQDELSSIVRSVETAKTDSERLEENKKIVKMRARAGVGVPVTVSQLVSDFDLNEPSAAAAYNGEVLRVAGLGRTAVRLERSEGGVALVMTEAAQDAAQLVTCVVEEDDTVAMSELRGMKLPSPVTLFGMPTKVVRSDGTVNVVLSPCAIVSGHVGP
jgi:sulfur carrier protein ThiS